MPVLAVFAESAVGIREGGRTGLSSFMVATGFGISMFLSPIFASIPPYATGPAIIVGERTAHAFCVHPSDSVQSSLHLVIARSA